MIYKAVSTTFKYCDVQFTSGAFPLLSPSHTLTESLDWSAQPLVSSNASEQNVNGDFYKLFL